MCLRRTPDPFVFPLHCSPFVIGQRRCVNGAPSVDGGARGAHVQDLPETFVVLLNPHVRVCCDAVVDACLGPSWVHGQHLPPHVRLPPAAGDDCGRTRHPPTLQVKTCPPVRLRPHAQNTQVSFTKQSLISRIKQPRTD